MDLNLVAQDLFDELKSRYSHLTIGDSQAMITTDPQLARFFKFDWNNYPVSIAIDEDNLRLVYNKDLSDSLEKEDQQSWYDFARTMREFAVTHNIGFKPQDIEKVDLEQGDFEFLSQVNTVQESKMHGTPKTSYDKLDKTRMVIRHSKQVDETVPGARSRNIDCIFIENAQGERFRFPFNYLKGARAMMMHVAQGGNPYDEIGESIVAKVDEIRQLRNFNSYTVRKGLLDETTAPYVEAAKARIQETIKTLEQLSKANSYQTALENLNTQSHELSEDDINDMKKRFTKETFDDSIVGAFKFLPLSELKPSDDDEGSMGRTDIMKQASTAGRYAQYVDNWLQDPESKLILKKDDSYDALQNNLRSQQKEMDLKLMTILRDIATRFLSSDPEDDAIVNFASDMESQISQAGELFAKPDPETKRLKGTAIKLANKYLTDMKRIKQDDAYKDEVRKSPEDIKAYKDIKGQEIGKGKLAKAYKRKYKDESEQFEAWVDSQIQGMDIMFENEDITQSQYQDAYKKKIDQLEVTEQEPTSNSPAADKIAQTAASYGKDDMDYDDLMQAAELLRAGKLQELGKFVYGLDTDPRELIMSIIQDNEPHTFKKMYGDQDGYMSLMKPMGMEEDDMSTGVVPVGKKGKTRRATGINDNPYDHNEGEDHPALVNAALWNMKDIYQTIMAGEEVSEDDMFSYGDVLQYLDMSGIPGYDFYEDFIDTVSTAVSQAQPGGFAGQGDAVLVDKKFASKIKTLYQQFKAVTAKIKGVKEVEDDHDEDVNDILRLSGIK